MYALSTSCKDWYKTIRNLLSVECGGEVTSLDKSVSFWTRQSFKYEYGRDVRDKNPMNLDQGVFEINDFPKQMEEEMPSVPFRYMWVIC